MVKTAPRTRQRATPSNTHAQRSDTAKAVAVSELSASCRARCPAIRSHEQVWQPGSVRRAVV
eukprot:208447-Prymnesium_polylepis.1